LTGVQQGVARSSEVAKQAGDVLAQRDTQAPVSVAMSITTAGLKRCDVGQGIAQDQAAFGIGIEDFDGLAGHGGDNVAGTGGAAARHVLGGGHHADHVDRQAELDHCRITPSTWRRRTCRTSFLPCRRRA
jgi:hypothetical protein